jgi:hypothetical protein
MFPPSSDGRRLSPAADCPPRQGALKEALMSAILTVAAAVCMVAFMMSHRGQHRERCLPVRHSMARKKSPAGEAGLRF